MNSIPIDWAEIAKSKKGVRTIDNKACGVVVSSAGDEIWVVDGAVNLKKYRIPKSKVNFYNGSELILKIPNFLMQEYEY
ncbi:MAG: hypothetical protein QOK72_09890 [Nitrososphaeraceae archaeon]|jgi:hypothetical protein|nr:hypothetical protein [Nitrososphaeraceae archaeon]